MTQEQWMKSWRFFVAVALALSVLATTLASIAIWTPAEEAVPRVSQCDVYTEQGCAKYVVASGGELEIQSGGTLDIQSGATTGLGAAMDLDSTLNVDGAVTFNSTLDVDGNISSGTGAITLTDSVNVTGAVDCDSTLNADDAVTFNSTLDVDGNISSGTGGITLTDTVNATGAVDFDSTLNVDGNATLVALLFLGFADETITDGETLTPTVTVYNLASAGAVTMTLAACSTDGQPLILVGDDANNITINDTNVRTNDGGVQVIGQFDVITWVCIDTEWVEVSESNNS